MSYCEFPEFYSDAWRVARKTHWCVECAAPIEKGERHYYYSGKWDGDFSSGRQHAACLDLCVFIRDHFQAGECFGFGDLNETWSEMEWLDRNRRYPWQRAWDEKDKEARSLMAKIKWRERHHLLKRKVIGAP